MVGEMAVAVFAVAMKRPWLYHLATRLAPLGQKFHPLVLGSALDPLQAWTKTREFPEAAPQSFRDLWRQRKGGGR